MRSSTSNSDPVSRHALWRGEVKALAVALLALLALEWHARDLASRPIWDRLLLRDLPANAKALDEKPGTSVVMLGNSLTRNGYDFDQLAREMPQYSSSPPNVLNMAMYGSSLVEWQYVFKNNFIETGYPPDIAIVNCSPGAVQDRSRHELRCDWLAIETKWSDAPSLLLHDFKDVGLFGDYAVSKASSAFAQRWDLRTNFLSKYIAHYVEGTTWVNDQANLAAMAQERRDVASAEQHQTYNTLKRFLALAGSHQVRVIVVALPVKDRYTVDPELVRTVEAAGHRFWDLTYLSPELQGGFEPDGWHMNKIGQERFTRAMAKLLPDAVEVAKAR